MRLYFAPMEGVTDCIFRRAYEACFGGVDKYFMPFVSPSPALSYTVREEYDLSPAQNRGLFAVPQILAKDAACFLGAVQGFQDRGYTEINLNLGCPSGTVTGKGKGAAMLRNIDELRRFLDAIYQASPLPISIKSRIGYEQPDEWEKLLPLFSDYPIHEFILHPRTRMQQYRETPFQALLQPTLETLKCPVIYNGDLFTARDVEHLAQQHPQTAGVMLGRGLLANPAMLRELKGGEPLQKEDLAHFHDYLFRVYEKEWPSAATVGRLHMFLKYFVHCLDAPPRLIRDALKATKPDEYQEAVSVLFQNAELRQIPRYSPPEWRTNL